ncbi:sensor histidine kinase [Solirubrobacter pauli]|uniref:ATP-binding protein n=1 Tax=Solirubrobacter pauli TaxID=166793 RepID=UPI0014774753|nr:sensor histidine kinase [Solirubrobacter pauli]
MLLAVAVVAAVTLVLYPISEIDPGVSSGVLYVLGVLVVTTTRGLRMGLFSAALSLFALDYFHTDPTGDLISGKSAGDLVAIFTVTLTAVVGAVIADTARRRAVESEERRVRLDEVRESRARVLAAADRERQRVVRDIHDGAQQRLVHTVVNLKLAVRQLDRDDPEAARPLVAEALQNAQAGTDELRELAHGIMPSVLTRGGLRAAVQTLTSRMPMPVVEDVTDERFPAEVESTAYFAVAEALTNVAKHAQAEEAYVTIAPADGVLRVEIRDDGVGGAFAGGSGLLGLEDRLAAAHGTLKVVSPPGDGTTISIELPVDAPTS